MRVAGNMRSLSVRRMFSDQRAMVAVLTFLRDTRVGYMVSLAPPEEEEEEDESENEDGPGQP